MSAYNARAIDVKYHLSCWVKNVQRNVNTCSDNKDQTLDDKNIGIVASDIEFVREKIPSHIDDGHFMKAKHRNELDRLFSTAVRDEDPMAKTIESSIRQQLFDSASVLRGTIADKTKHPWTFEEELNTDDPEKPVLKVLDASSADYWKNQPQTSRQWWYALPPCIAMF